MRRLVDDARPDYVFHLAAQAFVPASWRSPVETFNTNVTGSLNLFEAIRNADCDPRIQIAGSSEEYGIRVHPNEVPITEDNPLRPLSPYGVSKAAMDLLGFQYFKSYGIKIVRTRAFNHTGPRRGEVYAVSDWSKQVAEIEAGRRKPVMQVGNLKAKRDFCDVRDVHAYWLAAPTKGKPGDVYNIAGRPHADHAAHPRPDSRHERQKHRSEAGPGPPPAERRHDIAGRRLEVQEANRMEAHHPLQADAAGHAGLLAGARLNTCEHLD